MYYELPHYVPYTTKEWYIEILKVLRTLKNRKCTDSTRKVQSMHLPTLPQCWEAFQNQRSERVLVWGWLHIKSMNVILEYKSKMEIN